MGSFKDFDKKAPPPGSLGVNERKNDEETGEPVQLPDDGTQRQQKQQTSSKRPQGGQQESSKR